MGRLRKAGVEGREELAKPLGGEKIAGTFPTRNEDEAKWQFPG
jgi:hypothetical protein